MTRIGMMTFLRNDNYGSILQAWALQRTLLDMGFDAIHIDYAPNKQEKIRNLLMSGNSPKLILEGIRKKSAAGKMHGGFAEFRAANILTTAVCRDHAALAKAAADFDVLLCGSDQIWSPVWLNPAYFLDFTDKPKVSYAPSLGVKDMPSRGKQRKIARLVKRFSAVSVREKEGARLIGQMTGFEPVVLPDPVMLVPKAQWQSVMDAHVPQDKYILCYFIGDNPSYWTAVADIAEREHCAVRVIPRTEGARNAGYPLEENVPPQRWLGLINGAAHVVTDSFHGATFSAILNRKCTIVRRYREDDPESKNSRTDQLLRNLGVSNLEDADWDTVNANLADKAEAAKVWLLDALNRAAP
nr:polysaccharide pyruvyl transferase family protein [Clostridia bacterium]